MSTYATTEQVVKYVEERRVKSERYFGEGVETLNHIFNVGFDFGLKGKEVR